MRKEFTRINTLADEEKVQETLNLFLACKSDEWATQLKESFYNNALHHLEEIAVLSSRKQQLQDFADYLLQREN